MKRKISIYSLLFILSGIIWSFKKPEALSYFGTYSQRVETLRSGLKEIQSDIKVSSVIQQEKWSEGIRQLRLKLKAADFWLRYLEPTLYKHINGPLPVEWETEVFEKFEKPYKREGAGLMLAQLYLSEADVKKDSLISLLNKAEKACNLYLSDSLMRVMDNPNTFYLCNRLFLLNLAAIYTTGYECGDANAVIPELRHLLKSVGVIYDQFNKTFPTYALENKYSELYNRSIQFAEEQSSSANEFDHFTFIKDFVNPLFVKNQEMIRAKKIYSRSNVDYALNKSATSIFDKALYDAQNGKGLFIRVNDEAQLMEIEEIGRQLFYDPILSGNNQRSCASCHKAENYFTDTNSVTALAFNGINRLERNTPDLMNVSYNHLIMQDGKHLTLQEQTKAVITNAQEMGGNAKDVLEKVLSCKEYKKAFKKFLAHTPQEKEITIEHVCSAITLYYTRATQKGVSPFDEAILGKHELNKEAKDGFNLFMNKAQCATCHFVPHFNGVKPPYIGSEFEVLGTPADTMYSVLSKDKGRYLIHSATETQNAFRTGTLRNIAKTKPYMHNGVFKTLNQVIDFYNNGGGVGHGLRLENQTLSSDSLKLTEKEKTALIAFMKSLTEACPKNQKPMRLPESRHKKLNTRTIGGLY